MIFCGQINDWSIGLNKGDKASEILDAAETLARKNGYGGFSFRDLAREIGIKSASVHYYFPTKESLGLALVKRYSQNIMITLGDPTKYKSPQKAITQYVDLFKNEMSKESMICLCCLLGAEFSSLPVAMREETKTFFSQNIEWLKSALSINNSVPIEEKRYQIAIKIVSTLQGAMIISQTLGNDSHFKKAITDLLDFK